MSNWTVWTAERYLSVVYEMMKQCQLKANVNQCDETTVDVIHDGRPADSKSYMWVHITGELGKVPPIIIYMNTRKHAIVIIQRRTIRIFPAFL